MNMSGFSRKARLRVSSPAALLAALSGLWLGTALIAAEGSGGKTGRLTVFAGAASQPATKEVARLFTAETGIPVDCTFGGSGTVLNQIRIEHFGDIYLPGSDDYMDKAEQEGLVDPVSRRVVCWLLPVICVPKGNPKQIKGLADLARPGLRVTIGDPRSVCLGSIAKAALEKAGIYAAVEKRVVTYAADCQQVANLIRMDEVDAAIGYDVFQRQSPDLMDAIPFAGATAVNVPAAVVTFSKHKVEAQRFADYLAGPKGREVFTRHGYTVDKP
jgi:molybdate transport system substrate-binding protein